VTGIARDKVLHIHPPAQAKAAQANDLIVSIDDFGILDAQKTGVVSHFALSPMPT
jgi:hypothetical protein